MDLHKMLVEAMMLLRSHGFLTESEREKVSERIYKWKKKVDANTLNKQYQ